MTFTWYLMEIVCYFLFKYKSTSKSNKLENPTYILLKKNNQTSYLLSFKLCAIVRIFPLQSFKSRGLPIPKSWEREIKSCFYILVSSFPFFGGVMFCVLTPHLMLSRNAECTTDRLKCTIYIFLTLYKKK